MSDEMGERLPTEVMKIPEILRKVNPNERAKSKAKGKFLPFITDYFIMIIFYY